MIKNIIYTEGEMVILDIMESQPQLKICSLYR